MAKALPEPTQAVKARGNAQPLQRFAGWRRWSLTGGPHQEKKWRKWRKRRKRRKRERLLEEVGEDDKDEEDEHVEDMSASA